MKTKGTEKTPSWERIVPHLPSLLGELMRAQSQGIATLTKGKVRQLLKEAGTYSGVYVFCQKKCGNAVYVGRSANLPQRLGTLHRSTRPNQATVTKCLKCLKKTSMEAARQDLYDNYHVRLLPVHDVHTRAVMEIYAAMKLGTTPKNIKRLQFNDFTEH